MADKIINTNWLDSYNEGGELDSTPETTEEKVLVDKDSNRPVQSDKEAKEQNVRALQQLLFDKGYYPEGTPATGEGRAVDNEWGDISQAALEKYEAENSGFFGNQLSPMMPLNISALRNDISGKDSPISRESLSDEELKALQKIVRTNLAKGKNYIEYADYDTGTQYGDVGGADSASYGDQISRGFDPNYTLKTTIGRAPITVTPNDTLVPDYYNFNNARKGDMEAYMKDVASNPSIYGAFRSAGTNFGSPEGEGAPVLINTNQIAPEKKEITTRDLLSSIGLKNGGWLNKY